MSDVKKFDNYFQDQFSNFEAEVPSHIWRNIVAERESKRPKGFWVGLGSTRNIAIIAASVIVVTSGIWMLANNNVEDKKATIATTKALQESTPVFIDNNSTANSNSESVSSTNTADKNSSEINNNNTAQTDKTIAANDNSETSGSVTATNNIKRQHVTVAGASATHQTKKTKNSTTSVEPDATELSDNDTNIESGEVNVVSTNTTRLQWNTEAEKIHVKPSSTSLTITPRKYSLPACPIMEKDIAGNKKYFEVYIGPDYAIRSFVDTPNSAYLQKRKESTQFTFAYSAGVRYTRVFRSGMSIRGGLNYSQINEKFTFVESNITQVTYIIDPVTGDTTGQFSSSGTRYKTTYNRYHTLDIPVLIGYEFGNGKFHANINAGAMINIYSWQKGEVLDTLNKPISINTSSQSQSPYQFKTNIGVGFTGGVSAYYKLTEQMHLLAEPYVRYNLSSISKEELTLKQKYTTIGLRLGVRYDLK